MQQERPSRCLTALGDGCRQRDDGVARVDKSRLYVTFCSSPTDGEASIMYVDFVIARRLQYAWLSRS